MIGRVVVRPLHFFDAGAAEVEYMLDRAGRSNRRWMFLGISRRISENRRLTLWVGGFFMGPWRASDQSR